MPGCNNFYTSPICVDNVTYWYHVSIFQILVEQYHSALSYTRILRFQECQLFSFVDSLSQFWKFSNFSLSSTPWRSKTELPDSRIFYCHLLNAFGDKHIDFVTESQVSFFLMCKYCLQNLTFSLLFTSASLCSPMLVNKRPDDF